MNNYSKPEVEIIEIKNSKVTIVTASDEDFDTPGIDLPSTN